MSEIFESHIAWRAFQVTICGVAIIAAIWGLSVGPEKWLDVGVYPVSADYAFVLPGEENSRPFVAALLFRKGVVRGVLIPKNAPTPAERAKVLPEAAEVIRDVLLERGVPEDAIRVIGSETASSWDDLALLAQFMRTHPEVTVLVITNSFHTRRCQWILNRQLGPEAGRVKLVAAPVEWYDGYRWYESREVATTMASEYLKLGFYWIRYGSGLVWISGIVVVMLLAFWLRRIEVCKRPIGEGSV